MIGSTISHYKILEKLGEGGMGVVYKAQDVKLDRVVALKFLPAHITSTELEQERFLQEAKAAATLNHPNVCTVYGIHEYADQQFIEMEFVDGVTLSHKIVSGPMQIDTAIRYAIQIADALQEAHSKGIVHRDIKAENVMVNAKDQVKVMDFGLAKFKGVARKSLTTSTVGTLAYMAPEQIQGTQVDARSDIFSFGVVLFEMLTGHLPFRGEHEAAIIYSILNEEAEPLDKYRADASSELLHVLNRALEKDPEDRYQTVHEMLIDLRRLKKETTRVVRPTAAVKPSEGLSGLQKSLREAGGDFGSLTGKPSEGLLSKKRIRQAVFGIGAFSVFLLLYFFAWPPLANTLFPAERIPIAVITFENQTGDAAFDYLRDAIPNLLTTSLEQSQYMRVTTWERMQDLLRQMGKQDVKVIDRDLGFELCRRDSVRALVIGSYVKAGEMFATDVKIIDVETKKLLKSAGSRGEGVGSILKTQIDDLSKQISSGFGVPEISIAAEQKPVAEVTTSSMDAYNYFLRGVQEGRKLYYQDARRFFEKAVQLDTTFAMAYLYLAGVYGSLGESKLRLEAYQKAFAQAERTSPREKLSIEAAYASVVERNPEKWLRLRQQLANEYPKEKSVHQSLGQYYRSTTREYDKAIREFEAVLSLDPNFGIALSELGYAYLDLGDYDKAMEAFKRYAAVSPGDANPIDDMGEAYYFMGKLDKAIEKYKEAYTIEPKWGSRWAVAHMYALKEDYPTAQQYLDEYISRTEAKGLQGQACVFKGFYHYWTGDLSKCIDNLDRAVKLYTSVGDEPMSRSADWLKGWIYYDRAMFELSQKYNNADWCEVWSNRFPRYSGMYSVHRYTLQGLIDLAKGRKDSAKAKLSTVSRLLKEATSMYEPEARSFHDILYSEIMLAQDSCDAVITLLGQAKPMPIPTLFMGPILVYNLPLLRDVLARAYVKKGEIDKAVAEYERLTVIDPNRKDRRFINPRYHYRLARLYEQKGVNEKAIKEYSKFLELWKDADKDLPEPKDARKRLAALKQK